MLVYTVHRLLLIIPTLFGIILMNVAVLQLASGGPAGQALAELRGTNAAGSNVAGALLAGPGAWSSKSRFPRLKNCGRCWPCSPGRRVQAASETA